MEWRQLGNLRSLLRFILREGNNVAERLQDTKRKSNKTQVNGSSVGSRSKEDCRVT